MSKDAFQYWTKVTVCCIGIVAIYWMSSYYGHPPTDNAPAFVPLSKTQPTAVIQCFFSPGDECEQEIVAELKHAQKRVLVQAYNFTSRPIVTGLLDAVSRGVAVEVIVDHSAITEKNGVVQILTMNELPVYDDAAHPIAHNKIVIIDDDELLTGSYNFTVSAHKNAENLLIIRDKQIVREYVANWEEHKAHSTRIK